MNPYGPALTTLTDWNATLARCEGCCEMPECVAPTWTCESISGIAHAYSGLDADYETALNAWVEGGEVGDPPAEPEGYGEWAAGCWTQFSEPEGEPEDDLPVMFRRWKQETGYEGEEGYYVTYNLAAWPIVGGITADPGASGEWIKKTWTGLEHETAYRSVSGFWWDDGEGDAGCTGGAYDATTDSLEIAHTADWVALNNPAEIEATTYIPANSRYGMGSSSGTYNTAQDLPTGGPCNWDNADEGIPWSVEFFKNEDEQWLSDSITKSELAAKAAENQPEWGGDGVGTSCAASLSVDWPSIGYHYTGDPAGWPGPEDLPFPTEAAATATRSRRKWTVPTTHLGTYYRVMWNVIEEPEGWDATINDPEITPPYPLPEGWEHPQIPDPEAPARSWVSEDLEWTWEGAAYNPEGPPDETRVSPWQVIDAPSTPGIRRIVNIRVWCYRGPYGSLPQTVGEQLPHLDADTGQQASATVLKVGNILTPPP